MTKPISSSIAIVVVVGFLAPKILHVVLTSPDLKLVVLGPLPNQRVKFVANMVMLLSSAGNGMTTNPIHLLVLIFLSFFISDPKPSDASLLGIHSTTEDPLWYPDSGATHHVTKDPTVYSTKQPYNDTETVKMGNDSGLFIANTGSAIFRSSLTDKPLLLCNLLHVPLITKNLLSVSQFARDNHV